MTHDSRVNRAHNTGQEYGDPERQAGDLLDGNSGRVEYHGHVEDLKRKINSKFRILVNLREDKPFEGKILARPRSGLDC